MLKLSKKADYAVVALSHLQQTGQPSSAKEIAETYGLSAQMLANVLKLLASAGILESKRGAAGGYRLKLKPSEISIGRVIEVIDGALSLSDCSSALKNCNSESNCPAKKPMLKIHKKIKGFVNDISLADLAEREQFPQITFSN